MKIEFYPVSEVTPDMVEDNRRHSLSLGLPLHTERPASRTKLAVVGSGPSVEAYTDELRAFDGDIWAINGAVTWLADQGIEATLFSACMPSDWSNLPAGAFSRVRRAVVSWSSSWALHRLLPDECDVILAKVEKAGTTSVTAVPMVAIEMGYRQIVFYGCESSFASRSHIDREEKQLSAMIVECNGQRFETNPQMLMQSFELGSIINGCPGVMSEKSGGLLRARMADKEYDVVSLSDEMTERLRG